MRSVNKVEFGRRGTNTAVNIFFTKTYSDGIPNLRVSCEWLILTVIVNTTDKKCYNGKVSFSSSVLT